MLINDGLSSMFNAFFMAFLMSSRVLHINPFCSFPLNKDKSFSYLIEGNRAVGGHDVDGFPSTMSVYISSSNPLWVYKRKDKLANCCMAMFSLIFNVYVIWIFLKFVENNTNLYIPLLLKMTNTTGSFWRIIVSTSIPLNPNALSPSTQITLDSGSWSLQYTAAAIANPRPTPIVPNVPASKRCLASLNNALDIIFLHLCWCYWGAFTSGHNKTM